MKKKVNVHVPYPMLIERFGEILKAGINPEVYLDADSLEELEAADLKRMRGALEREGICCSIHGPYMDISPGAADEEVRSVAAYRFGQVLDAVEQLRPVSVVLHADYDARRYDGDEDLWFNQSIKTWPEIIRRAEKAETVIAIENVFEEGPETIKRLIEHFSSPALQVCLDAGHINIFSAVEIEDWFKEIGRYVGEVHLHDNNGKFDEHLSLGDGTIDFSRFFTLLNEYSKDPVYTIEPHGEDVLWRALEAVKKFL